MTAFKINLRSAYLFLFLFTGINFLNAQRDTVEIVNTIDLARAEFYDNPRKSISLGLKALTLSEKGGYKKFVAKSYNTIGSGYYFLSLYDSAELSHRRALDIQRELNDYEGLGRSYTNLGSIYSDRAQNDKAIEYFLIAEKKFELCSYRVGQAKLNNSLGILFYNIKDYGNAVKYFKNGLKIAAGFSDQTLYYTLSINMANALGDAGKMEEAIDLYKQSYAVAAMSENKRDLLVVCNNICQSYLALDSLAGSYRARFDSARRYDGIALQLLGNLDQATQYKQMAYINHATLLRHDGKLNEALVYLDTALIIARDFQDIQKQIGLFDQRSQILQQQKKFEPALDALRLSFDLRDSMYTINLRTHITETNAKHNVEKKESEIAKLKVKRSNQKKVNTLLIVIISLVFISLVIMIYNYIQKKKDNTLISLQKKEVELKNQLIEEKQQEIIDSINYAKRLQEAILPPPGYWKKYLPDSFVLYLPKAIVAGDFYWMETGNSDTGAPLVFFAAGDCTGHGVPGAMVSVVCSNALNRSVIEFHLKTPGEILNKTRELVVDTFQKSSNEVKDGMDISFCCLNLESHLLQWAGANNPLWMVRQSQFTEIKADKQPIGKYVSEKPFTTHSVQLQKGDTLYLLTDGYADQFGGPEGKKFKYKALQELIVNVQTKQMPVQEQLLQEAFNTWKGTLEQVDDVCVIGIRV